MDCEALMNVLEWSESELDYGRRLMDSAVEGARRGEAELLKDESLVRYLESSALHAMVPATVGACLGWLGGYFDDGRSKSRALMCGFLGGVIGFGAGVIWQNRKLTASIASGAWKTVSKTRDAHWFEKNPITYA
jgi:hypothetical protein